MATGWISGQSLIYPGWPLAAVEDTTFTSVMWRHTPLLKPSAVFSRFYIEKQPFFCRLESEWDRRSPIGIRLRLGSLDYVNALENKQ